MSATPLTGIRVLDFTRMFAGPCAAEILGDLGAEVIKVEEPRIGDPTRRNLPFWGRESAYFMSLNRGKSSVTLDLRDQDGLAAAQRLVATADVVLENFRPGVMKRLGLDYLTVRDHRPEIVYCSLSGFGATGPLTEKISFDLVNQAMAGLIDLTGDPDDRPVRIGVPIGDMGGGLFMALAAVAGLLARDARGHGCWFDLSLHDTLVSLLGDVARHHLVDGRNPSRTGHLDPQLAPDGCFRTRDGWLVLGAARAEHWKALLQVLGLEDLCSDERFADDDVRRQNAGPLHAVLEGRLSTQDTSEWLPALHDAGVPAAPVLTLGDALGSDLVNASGIVFGSRHPTVGEVRNLASPMVLDGVRAGLGGSSPVLGADTVQVLRQVGYDDDRIADLAARGVVRTPDHPYPDPTRQT